MKIKLSILALSIMLITGCATSQLPTNTKELNNMENFQSYIDYSQSKQLITGYNKAELNDLLNTGLKSNLDLLNSTGSVNAALYSARLTNTNVNPSFNAYLGTSTNRDFSSGTSNAAQFSSSVSASYEIDLWNKLKNQRASKQLEFYATQHDRETLTISIIAAIEDAYFKIAYLADSIRVTENSIAYYQRISDLANKKYTLGNTAYLNVLEAKQAVIQQDIRLKDLLLENQTAYSELKILLNLKPETKIVMDSPSLANTEIKQLPADVQFKELIKRPDIQAADARLRASFLDTEATKASYYPTFSLTSSIGSSSEELRKVLTNPVGSLGANIALPFLNWNERKWELAISKNEYEIRSNDYTKVTLNALHEADNAIKTYASLYSKIEDVNKTLENAKRISQINKVKYDAGNIEIKDWLDSEESQRQTELNILQLKYNLITSKTSLYKALGGKI